MDRYLVETCIKHLTFCYTNAIFTLATYQSYIHHVHRGKCKISMYRITIIWYSRAAKNNRFYTLQRILKLIVTQGSRVIRLACARIWWQSLPMFDTCVYPDTGFPGRTYWHRFVATIAEKLLIQQKLLSAVSSIHIQSNSLSPTQLTVNS